MRCSRGGEFWWSRTTSGTCIHSRAFSNRAGLGCRLRETAVRRLEAIEKSFGEEGNAIDLVLMDVMMPIMDGLTATHQIRQNPDWKKLPIIMLTAKAMPDDQERCLAAGANDYMAKPLDVEKLLSLIRVWMPSN